VHNCTIRHITFCHAQRCTAALSSRCDWAKKTWPMLIKPSAAGYRSPNPLSRAACPRHTRRARTTRKMCSWNTFTNMEMHEHGRCCVHRCLCACAARLARDGEVVTLTFFVMCAVRERRSLASAFGGMFFGRERWGCSLRGGLRPRAVQQWAM
jgi:hypothetical protein